MKPIGPLKRSFWITTITAFAVSMVGAHAIAAFYLPQAILKPPFSLLIRSYVAGYPRGHTDHYMFRYGIFGFGERIRSADILILGTSHPQLGLSAAQLSQQLSTQLGRPIKAFNMGLGFGDGMGFANAVLTANGVHDKGLIVDLYQPWGGGMSEYARGAVDADVAIAYAKTCLIWADFVRDWVFDGIFPRLTLAPSSPKRTDRFLGLALFRDWRTGDVVDIWWPDRGLIYQNPPPEMMHGLVEGPPPTGLPNDGISLPEDSARLLEERKLAAILTLLPYQGYDLGKADGIARRYGLSLTTVSPDGLTFLDTNHLTADGRGLATKRLAAELPAGWMRREAR